MGFVDIFLAVFVALVAIVGIGGFIIASKDDKK
jgi:hypothetical protein